MFNMTFQWDISSFWNSRMVFFSSPDLQVLPQYPFIPVLRMTEMKWAAGKGSYRHTSFHLKRLKTQLSSLARLLLLRLLSTFLRRLMSVCMRAARLAGTREWGFVCLFSALKEVFSARHAGAQTHTVLFIIIIIVQRHTDFCMNQRPAVVFKTKRVRWIVFIQPCKTYYTVKIKKYCKNIRPLL